MAAGASVVVARRGAGDMDIGRIVRHLFAGPASIRRVLPAASLARIEQAIAASERRHRGQIRFAVEAGLDFAAVGAGLTARERAIDMFSRLRVWDTAHNNGVLVYLLLADRDVEIVADRGIHARCGDAVWESICRDMEQQFRAGRFEDGVVAGIEALGARLALHFPGDGETTNELPNSPVIL